MSKSCMGHKPRGMRRTGKFQIGPGGITCSCCIPFSTIREMKVRCRRYERHVANATVHKDIEKSMVA